MKKPPKPVSVSGFDFPETKPALEPFFPWADKMVSPKDKPKDSRSVKVIDSVFRLRRILARLIKDSLLFPSFPLEDLTLLLALFGARRFGWSDPKADADGFVSLSDLKRAPVDAALLTRRIADLEEQGWVQLTKAQRGKSKRVRITDEGIKFFQPVYVVYTRLADRILEGLSNEDIERFWATSEFLIKRIQWKA